MSALDKLPPTLTVDLLFGQPLCIKYLKIQNVCSENENLDTPDCWTERLNTYITNTSFLMRPARQCINQYATDIARGLGKLITR